MLRLLADENVNDDIVRGLLLRQPNIDIVCARDVGLTAADDRDVLAWAAANDRILVTHDRATIPDHAYEHVTAGDPMPGVFLLNDRLPVGRAIEELLLMHECCEQSEWNGRVIHLPIRTVLFSCYWNYGHVDPSTLNMRDFRANRLTRRASFLMDLYARPRAMSQRGRKCIGSI